MNSFPISKQNRKTNVQSVVKILLIAKNFTFGILSSNPSLCAQNIGQTNQTWKFGAEKVLLQGYVRNQAPRRVLAKNFKKCDEEGVSGSVISECTIL